MNHFNALHVEEPNEPPRYCNSQPPEAHFKSITYPLNTSPVVSAITSIINQHVIDNFDVEVHPSEFPVGFKPESVPDLDTTLIRSIDDDEMGHLL